MSTPSRRRLDCLILVLLASAIASGARGESLVAERVTSETAPTLLFSGSDALGGIGDWYLSNGIVQAVVDDLGYQQDVREATGRHLPIRSYGFSGGSVIDLGLVGQNGDQFNSLLQMASLGGQQGLQDTPIVYVPAALALGDPSLPAVVADVDALEGAASLTVFGYVFLPEGGVSTGRLLVTTEYAVRRGESFLRIATTVANVSEAPFEVLAIGDVALLATGGLHPFVAAPGLGFAVPSDPVVTPYFTLVGRVEPADGVIDTAAMLESGEASYTIVSPEEAFLLAYGSPVFFTIRTPRRPDALEPGQSLRYDRHVFVGGRNDVASSATGAVRQLAAVHGFPTGTVRGRLTTSDGMPFRASVGIALVDLDTSTLEPLTLVSTVTGDARPEPLSQATTNALADGRFEVVLPAGRHELVVKSEERGEIGPVQFTLRAGEDLDLGEMQLSALGRLLVRVTDAQSGLRIPGKFTIQGRNGSPNPSFGSPIDVMMNGKPLQTQTSHASPARNMAYTVDGEAELFVKPGEYAVFASRGLEYDYAVANATVGGGSTTSVELAVRKVVDTTGYVSADFHVHSARSPDSSVPPYDRIFNFAAQGVQVLVASDHNTNFDYQPLIDLLGLGAQMRAVVGVEVTTGAWSPLEAGFSSLGHWNGWPQQVHPHARKDGAPEEGYVEPNVVFDRLRQGGAEVVQLNHPFWGGQGFFSRIRYDPTKPLDAAPNGFLLREAITGSGTRNLDFDAIEIYNGSGPFKGYLAARYAWFSLLNQGVLITGTAVTDTHHVAIRHGGSPRTYVASAAADMRELDVAAFNDSLKAMRAFGSSGPFVEVALATDQGVAGLGETVSLGSGTASLRATVRAPCWIPVEEVRFYANGGLLATIPLSESCASELRYDDALAVRPATDTYFVVEAGQRLPATPDEEPALPTGVMAVIEPGVVPLAFTNPVFLDVDGNGRFDPPGLPAAAVR